MTFKFLCPLLFLFVVFGASGASAQNSIKINADDLLADLETLQFWIHEAHGDPFRFTSKEEIDLQFESSKIRVHNNNGLELGEFFQETMKIMALLKDGHSQSFMPNLDTIEGKVFFPVLIRFIDYKPYVLHNLNESDDVSIGSEIISINDRSSEELFSELAGFVHGDGSIKLSKYRKLESNFYLTRLFKVFDVSEDYYQITVRSPGGGIQTFNIEALTQAEAQRGIQDYRSQHPKKELYDLTILDDVESSAVLTVGSFNTRIFNDDYDLYCNTIDNYFAIIRESGIKNLILDLRNNTGGEDSYEAYLLRYLMSESFEMYGQLTFRKNDYKFLPDGKHWDIPESGFQKNEMGTYDATEALWEAGQSTLGIHYPFENKFEGKLIVLINARTFSAASGMASFLHYSKRAIFVGEETAGSYIGSVAGYNPTIDLPNTQISINLPLMNIRRPFFNEAWTGRGVISDIQIEPTINDLINGSDVVLETAINLISNQ